MQPRRTFMRIYDGLEPPVRWAKYDAPIARLVTNVIRFALTALIISLVLTILVFI